MTLALRHWLGRLLLTADYPTPDRALDTARPTKIEVERLPDYLWRELGFQRPYRPDEDPWRHTQ